MHNVFPLTITVARGTLHKVLLFARCVPVGSSLADIARNIRFSARLRILSR